MDELAIIFPDLEAVGARIFCVEGMATTGISPGTSAFFLCSVPKIWKAKMFSNALDFVTQRLIG